MGNCLTSHESEMLSPDFMGREKFILVMRSDGKIMEYMPPILVRDLMAAYPQHSVVHSEDATCHFLAADKKLVPGQLYRVLRNPKAPSLSKLDAVLSEAKSAHNGSLEDKISSERRANNQAHSSVKSVQNGSGFITVKMVISKRELDALLSDRSMNEKSILCKAGQYAKKEYVANRRCNDDGWRPSLESIPEVN